MMHTYKLRVRLWIVTAFLLCSSSLVFAERGILWEVQQPGDSRSSYVFGTIHSDDSRVTRLPIPVVQVFAQAKSFTAELKLDAKTILQAQRMTMLPPGQKLQPMLGEKRYRKSIELLARHGVPKVMAQQMKPWAIAVQLSMPKPGSGVFLDMQLYQSAVQRRLPTYGLETVNEQLYTFESLSLGQQVTLLDDAIAKHAQLPKAIDRLIQYYLQRDLDAMQDYSNSYLASEDMAMTRLFSEELIVRRNHRMVARMQPRLDEGDAFIAVGALHLPGEQGILALLRERGFRVKAFY